MKGWSFLTNHARVLTFIAHHPDARLRDVATTLDITERTVFGIVDDLIGAGYLVKEKEGRRNRYHFQADRPLRGSLSRERTIGEILDLLIDSGQPPTDVSHRTPPTRSAAPARLTRRRPRKP